MVFRLRVAFTSGTTVTREGQSRQAKALFDMLQRSSVKRICNYLLSLRNTKNCLERMPWIQPDFLSGSAAPARPAGPSTSDDLDTASDTDCQIISSSVRPTGTKRPNHSPKDVRSTKRKKPDEGHIASALWTDKYLPKSQADLCVKKKKLTEISSWMENMKKASASRVLVVTGPPGCGKSTAIRMVAQELSIKTTEWESPVVHYVQDQDNAFYESSESLFSNFLLRSSRYARPMIFDIPDDGDDSASAAQGSVILVEDIPNFCFREPEKFHDILDVFVRSAATGVMFVLTENNANNSQFWRLFPPALMARLDISNIRFNPIVKTSVKKILTQILKAEFPQGKDGILSPETLEDITETANGDIRGAISALQFAVEGKRPQGKKKASFIAHEKGFSQRDTSLLLFRAVGRVFYVKRNVDEPPITIGLPVSQLDHLRCPLTYVPEEIAERCPTNTGTFLSFIHGNYPYFLRTIHDVVAGAEWYSVADMIDPGMTESRDKVRDCAASVIMRGLMHLNRTGTVDKATATFRAMEKPLLPIVEKKVDERRRAGYNVAYETNTSVNLSALFTEYFPFLGKIGNYPGLAGTRKYVQDMCFFSPGSLKREAIKEDEYRDPDPPSPGPLSQPGPASAVLSRERSVQMMADAVQDIDISDWAEDFVQDGSQPGGPAEATPMCAGTAAEWVIEEFSDEE